MAHSNGRLAYLASLANLDFKFSWNFKVVWTSVWTSVWTPVGRLGEPEAVEVK